MSATCDFFARDSVHSGTISVYIQFDSGTISVLIQSCTGATPADSTRWPAKPYTKRHIFVRVLVSATMPKRDYGAALGDDANFERALIAEEAYQARKRARGMHALRTFRMWPRGRPIITADGGLNYPDDDIDDFGEHVVAVRAKYAAKRAARLAMSYPRTLVAGEKKYFDTTGNFTVPGGADWTGTEVVCTNYIQSDGTTVGAYTASALIPSANGTGYGQVVGGKYRLHSLHIRGELTITPVGDLADVDGGVTSRLVLVHDKMCGATGTGTQLQGEDVFTDLAGVTQNVFAFPQKGQIESQRFNIMRDLCRVHNVTATQTDGASTASNGWQEHKFEFKINFKKPLIVHMSTAGATPAIAQLKDHNIFMLALAQRAGVCTFAARAVYSE